ncbi:hypothetical protein M8494_35890 [Serratia ureilytica]
MPIGLLLDERSQRLYVANRKGVRVDPARDMTVFDAADAQAPANRRPAAAPNRSGVGSKGDALFVTVKNDGASTKAGKPESVVRIQLRAS